MQVTVDSRDSLEHALRVVGSLYGVELAVGTSGDSSSDDSQATDDVAASAPAARRRPASRRQPQKSADGSRPSRRRSTGGTSKATDLAAVRSWARDNGYEVSDRGRVSNAVLEAYREQASVS